MFSLWILTIFIGFEITNATQVQSDANTTLQCGNVTCYNGPQCNNNSKGIMDACQCKQGFTGNTCLNDIDECRGRSPCYNRGICHNSFGSFSCDCFKGWSSGHDKHCGIKDNSTEDEDRICKTGWMGEWCQDQCLNDSMCQPHQVCVETSNGLISQKVHICRCVKGWHGLTCDTDENECGYANTCPQNKSCLNTPGSFKCICFKGWKGVNCTVDIDECLTNPCQHSSNCTNIKGSYNCTCAKGWKGVNCSEDVDECSPNPCSERQTCNNTLGSYTCPCVQGWQGTKCDVDIDECLEFPCLNAGTCVNTNGSYYCNCTSGWNGLACENDIDECDENPCNGTFTCANSIGSYTCSSGQLSVTGNNDARNTYIIVGSVLGSLLLLCSIAVLAWICKKKKRNATSVNTSNVNEKQENSSDISTLN